MAASSTSEGGPNAVLVNVAQNTTLHGVPNAYHARSWIRKAIWSSLFLASCGMCLYQLVSNFQKYLGYPTTSTSAVVTGHQRDFPAVTFCNMNPVRQSHMNQSVLEQLSLENDEWDNFVTFQRWYAPLFYEEKLSMGHVLDHMLLSCEFAGNKCNVSESFTQVLNGQYGNCYTFNSGNTTKRLESSSAGPKGGLILELYIQQNEYLPILSDTAGIRLIIHNHTYMPLPEKEGIVLSPGVATNIAITKTEVKRAKPPHGACDDISAERNRDLNVYTHFYGYIDYTYQACRFTCYQTNVIATCKCGDALYPLSGRPFVGLNGADAKPCKSEDEQSCVHAQLDSFNKGMDNCTTACPIMCFEISYDQKFSFGLWPSESAKDKIFEKIYKGLGEDGLADVFDNISTDGQQLAWMQSNVVKAVVYFERLDYNTHTTKGSYSKTNLISDQGGQVGLWLGLSMLTLFEMVELLWDLLVSVIPVTNKTAPGKTGSGKSSPENRTT